MGIFNSTVVLRESSRSREIQPLLDLNNAVRQEHPSRAKTRQRAEDIVRRDEEIRRMTEMHVRILESSCLDDKYL